MRPATALRWCAWSGPAGMLLLLFGQAGIARFVPPPAPSHTAATIAAIYHDHNDGIRAGLIIAVVGATLLGPWCAGIAVVMHRIEGRLAPMTALQLIFGGILVFEFLVPLMMWQAAAFRPDGSPEITARLHDLGSLTYDGLPTTAVLQCVAFAVVILSPRNRDLRLLPRWLGWLSLWAAMNFLPGLLNPLAHSGPLAWNGAFSWWLGLTVFGVWILAVTRALLIHAIPALEREQDAEDAGPRPLQAGVPAVALEPVS